MKCKRIFALMIAGLFALSGCGENRTVSEQLSETSQTSQISTEISDCFSCSILGVNDSFIFSPFLFLSF